MPTKRAMMISGVAATALALAVAAPTDAGQGGARTPANCGVGRSRSELLRDFRKLPGASEIKDIPTDECNASTKN